METAAAADGVISVALEGENKDKVVVLGDGVDAADFQQSKKLGHASLEMVDQVEEKQDNKIEEEETKPSTSSSPPTSPYPSSYFQTSGELWKVVYDPQPAAGPCAIM